MSNYSNQWTADIHWVFTKTYDLTNTSWKLSLKFLWTVVEDILSQYFYIILQSQSIPATRGSQTPVIHLKLVGDLKGQGSAQGQVSEGEINHEDDGGSLGVGTEEEDPHGKAISNQVNGSNDDVDDRDGNAGVCIL